MPNLLNGSKEGSNPGSLDCEFGILLLSYRKTYSALCACFDCLFLWVFLLQICVLY